MAVLESFTKLLSDLLQDALALLLLRVQGLNRILFLRLRLSQRLVPGRQRRVLGRQLLAQLGNLLVTFLQSIGEGKRMEGW